MVYYSTSSTRAKLLTTFRNLLAVGFSNAYERRIMNPPETATDATRRLEMRLGDLGVPGKFVDEIIGHHTVVNYNKGSMVFLQGSPADVMFWVLAGLVKVYCPRPDGTRIQVFSISHQCRLRSCI